MIIHGQNTLYRQDKYCVHTTDDNVGRKSGNNAYNVAFLPLELFAFSKIMFRARVEKEVVEKDAHKRG